jgi:long-chain acyl-CoA synthetase
MVRRALDRAPETQAIEFEGRWHSWGEIRAQADRIRALLITSGIDDNAPIAFVPRNRPYSIAALLALLAESRTVRMIYAFQSAEAIANDIMRLEPAAVILDKQNLAGPITAVLGDAGIGAIAIGDGEPQLFQKANSNAKYRAAAHEPLIEILTSGTTGPPKQFPIRHKMIAENLIGMTALELHAQAGAAKLPPALLYFPLGNISGIYSTIPPLVKGQRVSLLDRFSIAAWHAYVVRHRPAQSGVPPAMMRALLDADIPTEDLASIKAMGSGAAPLDPKLQRTFEERYGIPILLSYGATEFGGPVCAWSLELHSEFGSTKLGSVGRPLSEIHLRIIDAESGAVLSHDQEGLLEVISPRIGPEWIRTSDIGMIDRDGFLFLRGRADGAINRGGFKLLPETIERALLQHPQVSQAAVVEVPDTRLGQVPGAAICMKPETYQIPPEMLELHLRRLLPATHIPAYWHFCDTLPFNASMKIDRAAIRRIFNDLLQI